MHICSIQCFNGKNIYSHKPVVKMVVDIGEYYNTPTKDIGDLNQKLLKLLPGLKKHYCSLGYEGGFVERLKEGTYLAHVIEHSIIELQNMLGYKVNYGKTRIVSEPSEYFIVYEYINEKCAVECGRVIFRLMADLINNKEPDMVQIIKKLRKISSESELGPSARALFDEAVKRGIPVTLLGNGSIMQLGYGKYSRLMEASISDGAGCISVDIAGDKHLSKKILQDNGIPVPYGGLVYSVDSAVEMADEIGYPVVLKPYNGNQGKGVTVNITNEAELKKAYRMALKYSKNIIVEKFISGKDYRVLVVGDKVSAVSERRPPYVIGDGNNSIKQLISIENKNPLRGEDHERPLTKIKLDDISRQILENKGIDENYVPEKGEKINLRYNGNLSTGGTARDCTDEIHPYNIELAVKAAKIIGLDIAGIDITAEDISKPLTDGNGAVIEVNAAPGLRMHLYPTEGKSRNVSADIIDMLFPAMQPVNIPIVSVTGTNGKTTTTRLIRHILTIYGKNVGMTTTSGIYIGDKCLFKGDNTGPSSARAVLSNKEVEAAVLETARGGIVKRGLGYDMADVGVIVNISEDHLGLDGINTLEDLAFVKALVIEAVKPDGYAVLNADDSMIEYFMGRTRSNVILFSRNKDNSIVQNHIKAGHKAVCLENNSIVIYDNNKAKCLIEADKIPITINGIVECNIENSLAAIASVYSLGVPCKTIEAGLISFKPDDQSNPGRFNIFDMGDFKIMLDYGHNPAGYEAVINVIQKMGSKRLIGVIGVPGDRDDQSTIKVGEISGKGFSKIYIKEDRDLRGRKPGEVAKLLMLGALKGGIRKESIEIEYSELKALEKAILDAQPGDLIVMFYEEFEPALQMVNRFKNELQNSGINAEILMEANQG